MLRNTIDCSVIFLMIRFVIDAWPLGGKEFEDGYFSVLQANEKRLCYENFICLK